MSSMLCPEGFSSSFTEAEMPERSLLQSRDVSCMLLRQHSAFDKEQRAHT